MKTVDETRAATLLGKPLEGISVGRNLSEGGRDLPNSSVSQELSRDRRRDAKAGCLVAAVIHDGCDPLVRPAEGNQNDEQKD